MKLRNKLLTVLPLTIGAVAPIITVTSCNKGSLSLSFADAVNCLNSKNKTVAKYYKTSKVANAAKDHIQVVEGTEIKLVEWAQNNIVQQQFYYDLVYSCANYNVPFMLKWEYAENDPHKFLTKGTFYLKEDTPIEFTSMKYYAKEDKIRIALVKANTEEVDVCQSYTYHLI